VRIEGHDRLVKVDECMRANASTHTRLGLSTLHPQAAQLDRHPCIRLEVAKELKQCPILRRGNPVGLDVTTRLIPDGTGEQHLEEVFVSGTREEEADGILKLLPAFNGSVFEQRV